MLNVARVNAVDIPDLWFQAVYSVLDKGRRFTIDKGSYAGQTRLEFDYFMGNITQPKTGSGTLGILPQIPEAYNIPNPVDFEYIYGGENYERSYIEYIMTPTKLENESYTYGERLTKAQLCRHNTFLYDTVQKELIDIETANISEDIVFSDGHYTFVNQVEWVIECYKRNGSRNNQMVLQVAQPDDILFLDPPCLRSIDTRIQDGKLHFFIYFRSWSLWGGLPANLAGIEALHQYMANAIGVDQGEFIVESKGLHLYGYEEDLAKIRCMKEDCV